MNKNILLQQNADTLTFEEVLIKQNYIDKGYIYPLAEMKILVKIEDLFSALEKDFGTIEIYDYSTKNLKFQNWVCDDFTLEVIKESEDVFVLSYCKSNKISTALFKIIESYKQPSSDTFIAVLSYFLEDGHLQNGYKEYEYKEYKNISSDFYPYICTDRMFEQFYTNKESILIVCGKPGTGKTSLSSALLKFSLDNYNFVPYKKEDGEYLKVAYVKSVDVISQDNFWVTLANDNFDLVILDDLDFFLTSRSAEVQTGDDVSKNRFLSNFLSYTDGIEQNKTKFIITTNQSYSNIDSALLRKGRLFDILELRELTNQEAEEIWVNNDLDIKDFNFKGTVLQAELGSQITKLKNKKIKLEPYLLEDNISKASKTHKKLGF